MRYVLETNRHLVHGLDTCEVIGRDGSAKEMQQKHGWRRGGQVRIGGFTYNVGINEVSRLRRLKGHILRGE